MRRNAIELRHLRYFAAIASAGSITGAAARLHVAQPAVSQQMRALETALGVPLLIRGSRGVSLTAEGRRVLGHCQEVFRSLDGLLDSVSDVMSEGDVALGLPMTVSPILTQPLMHATRKNHPKVRVRISEGMSAFLAEWLIEERLDSAVLFLNQAHPEIDLEDIVSERLYLVGGAGAFSPGQQVPLRELPRFPLIIPNEQNALHQLVRDTARARGVAHTVRFEIDVVSEMKRFVEAGEGYAVLAPIAFHDEVRTGRLSAAQIIDPEITRTWAWATKKGRIPDPAVRAIKATATRILLEQTRRVEAAIERDSAVIPHDA